MEQMRTTLLGRNEFLHLIREKESSHLVIVQNGAVAQNSRNLGYPLPFRSFTSTEKSASGHIHKQNHSQFTLLFEHFHVRLAKAGGNVPIHRTHVVSPLILPNLAKGHTPTLEGRVILSRKDLMRESLSPDFDLSNLLQEFRGIGLGTMER